MADREIDFGDMVGGEFDFYGCDGQCFNLDGLVYEVIEEDLGIHGSGLDHVEISDASSADFDLPVARVVIEEADVGVYELTDLHDDHCWLRFGTEYQCDDVGRVVGQSFVFEYTPRGPGD